MDYGDIREGRESGNGERIWSEVRGEKGEPRGGAPREGATAAAKAMSWRSSSVTITSMDLPGLF